MRYPCISAALQCLGVPRPHSLDKNYSLEHLRSAPMMRGDLMIAHSAKCALCSVWLIARPTGLPTCAWTCSFIDDVTHAGKHAHSI